MIIIKKLKNVTISLFVINLLFLISVNAFAGKSPGGNYYVAQQDKNASDNNLGTQKSPFKSINACLKKIKLKPGDTVWIKNGVYREALLLKNKTTRRKWKGDVAIASGEGYSKMINICGYPGQQPVIKGSDVVSGWKKYKNNIWVRDNWTVNSQQIFADDQLLTQIGGEMKSGYLTTAWHWEYKGKTLKDMISGSFYCDVKGKKLYVWLNDGKNPNHAMMEASTRLMTILLWKLKYIRISDLKITHGNNFTTNSAIIVLSDNCIFENIDQSLHAFGGIKVCGEYNLVNRCRFNMNGDYGMGGISRGHRILNCETKFNNYRNWSSSWHAGGVKFISDCHDWIIKGHVSAYNNGDGIWFDDGMSNVTIEGCLSYRNKGYGIHYEIGSRGVIKNNICYENLGRGIYVSNSSYTLVSNNLCYRNGMSGIVNIGVKRFGAEVYNRGTNNVLPAEHNLVTGNILVDNCDASYLLQTCGSWSLPANFKQRFKLYAGKYIKWGYRPELIMPDDSDSNSGCFSDYNLFYRSGKRNDENKLRFGRNWSVSYAVGLKKWREKTGFDKHSKFVKPQFVNEKIYNFHPKNNCPSLWFVQKTDMGVKFDFNSVLRPGGRSSRTAGPFGGNKKVFDKLKKQPQNASFTIIPVPIYRKRDDFWMHVRLSEYAMVNQIGLKSITPITKGVYINNVPFLVSRGNKIIITQKNNKKTIKCGKAVKKLYFLMTALNFSTKPFLQCIISRQDGVKINMKWQGDGKGGIRNVLDKDFQTVLAWNGKTKKGKDSKIFVSSWDNTNEWLPVKNIEFKLLDTNAKVGVISITGRNLPKK